MKKFLMLLMVCGGVLGTVDTARAGSTDDIMNACYAVTDCGGKTALRAFVPSSASDAALTLGLTGGALMVLGGPFAVIPAGATILSGAALGLAGSIIGDDIGGKMSAAYSANEYIYFDNGKCIECDTHQFGEHYECPNGTIVFNGSKAMRCHTTASGDYWGDMTLPVCAKSPIKNKSEANTVATVNASVTKEVHSGVGVYSGDACFYIDCVPGYEAVGGKCQKQGGGRGDTVKNCLTSGHKAGDTWAVDCKTLGITGGVKCGKRCNSDGSETGYVTQCENNYKLDGLAFTDSKDKYKRCKKIGGQDTEPSVLEKCLASRNTAEGKACCYLPNSVATWDGQKCNCVIEGMEFKIENGVGKCDAKQTQPGETFKCNAAHLALLEGWLVSCKDKPTIVSTINQIKVLCASPNVTTEDFNALWTVLMSLNPGECGTQPDLPPPPQVDDGAEKLRVSIRIIRDAHSNLSDMAEGFKVSVWKDEEGKFNTSRLVSDSVAGVVLGTAGGLITSNVVKKNQVENGFEDMKCTIGGQVVADWGDQFRVGIQ